MSRECDGTGDVTGAVTRAVVPVPVHQNMDKISMGAHHAVYTLLAKIWLFLAKIWLFWLKIWLNLAKIWLNLAENG